MSSFSKRPYVRRLIIAAFIAGTLCIAGIASAASRNVLWEIVSGCLDPTIPNYCTLCRWPLATSPCGADKRCEKTSELWAETADYAAIRDIKMCNCPEGFVHGLVLPRTRVTGVEDPHRPDGIWNFAWTVAARRIHDPSHICLVVNPSGMRTQDQLHVHIMRLQSDARQKLEKCSGVHITDLDTVWETAGKLAADNGLRDYGVIVIQTSGGGYWVHIEKESPEREYGVISCR